jgi:hypothetical protein
MISVGSPQNKIYPIYQDTQLDSFTERNSPRLDVVFHKRSTDNQVSNQGERLDLYQKICAGIIASLFI